MDEYQLKAVLNFIKHLNTKQGEEWSTVNMEVTAVSVTFTNSEETYTILPDATLAFYVIPLCA